jgi:hypothetical protein
MQRSVRFLSWDFISLSGVCWLGSFMDSPCVVIFQFVLLLPVSVLPVSQPRTWSLFLAAALWFSNSYYCCRFRFCPWVNRAPGLCFSRPVAGFFFLLTSRELPARFPFSAVLRAVDFIFLFGFRSPRSCAPGQGLVVPCSVPHTRSKHHLFSFVRARLCRDPFWRPGIRFPVQPMEQVRVTCFRLLLTARLQFFWSPVTRAISRCYWLCSECLTKCL